MILDIWGARDGTVVRALASHQCGWVQLPASTPYVGWVCCWFSLLIREVFLQALPFSPLLKNQPNSNSIWNTQTRLNKFIWTPRWFVGKQEVHIFFLILTIWRKYHLWYFKIVSNFTCLAAHEITLYNNFKISVVVFMPINITIQIIILKGRKEGANNEREHFRSFPFNKL